MSLRSKCCFMVVLLAAFAGQAKALDSRVDGLLLRTEALRSSDTKAFGQAMAQLDALMSQASPAQRQRIQILHAYNKAITGDSEGAIDSLVAILANANDPDVRFRAGTLLANIYAIAGQFHQGLKVLGEVLPLQNEVVNRRTLHVGWGSAGVIYSQVGAFDLASEYGKKILGDDPEPRNRCGAENLLLETALGKNELLDVKHIQDVVARCESQSDPVMTGFTYTYLARAEFAKGHVGDAIAVLEKELPAVEATRYPRLIGEYESLLAKYRAQQGDAAAAESHARRTLGYEGALANTEPLAVAFHALYQVALQRNDLAAALEAYRNYSGAELGLAEVRKSRAMAFQLVKQEIAQKSQEIALLDQQNKLLQLQQKVERKSAQNAKLVALVLALIAAAIGYWAYRLKKVQRSLRRRAETDSLTRLHNRHRFSQLAQDALVAEARDGGGAALLMFDLDHFKSINDRFGHGAGDWVLREVAAACSPLCREVDHFGRLGGEEFAVLLRGCDHRAAARLAEDLRARVAAMSTANSGYSFVVTASFGVTSTGLSGYDLARLMSHADRAMYRSKREGRNRVSIFEADVLPTESVLFPLERELAGDNVVALSSEAATRL